MKSSRDCDGAVMIAAAVTGGTSAEAAKIDVAEIGAAKGETSVVASLLFTTSVRNSILRPSLWKQSGRCVTTQSSFPKYV